MSGRLQTDLQEYQSSSCSRSSSLGRSDQTVSGDDGVIEDFSFSMRPVSIIEDVSFSPRSHREGLRGSLYRTLLGLENTLGCHEHYLTAKKVTAICMAFSLCVIEGTFHECSKIAVILLLAVKSEESLSLHEQQFIIGEVLTLLLTDFDANVCFIAYECTVQMLLHQNDEVRAVFNDNGGMFTFCKVMFDRELLISF